MNRQARKRKHYWVRKDFDEAMTFLNDFISPPVDTSFSLKYPKSVKGAVAELYLRGLTCDEAELESLVKDGFVSTGVAPSTTCWTAADIDAAADWLYKNERWTPWVSFCMRSDLRYGQAVRAHRYVCARHNMGFSASFDPIGLVTVIEPTEKPGGYARVRFYPKGAQVEVNEFAEVSRKPGINLNRRHGHAS